MLPPVAMIAAEVRRDVAAGQVGRAEAVVDVAVQALLEGDAGLVTPEPVLELVPVGAGAREAQPRHGFLLFTIKHQFGEVVLGMNKKPDPAVLEKMQQAAEEMAVKVTSQLGEA